jgi:hypothetical protein
MRKFRASLEPFWDLKIGRYVEYLMPVSSEYLISCELLSLTSTAGRTSRVFLAYVIPWINKASIALYIARHRAACHDLIWSSEAVLCCRVHPYGWSIEICHYRDRKSISDYISAIEAPGCGTCTMYALYWRPFTICTVTTAATGDMVNSFILLNMIVLILSSQNVVKKIMFCYSHYSVGPH